MQVTVECLQIVVEHSLKRDFEPLKMKTFSTLNSYET